MEITDLVELLETRKTENQVECLKRCTMSVLGSINLCWNYARFSLVSGMSARLCFLVDRKRARKLYGINGIIGIIGIKETITGT